MRVMTTLPSANRNASELYETRCADTVLAAADGGGRNKRTHKNKFSRCRPSMYALNK